MPLVRPRRSRAALRAMRVRRRPRRRGRRPPHRRGTRPGVSRHHGRHLRRRHRDLDGARRPRPRRRHPGCRAGRRRAATAPRCCSTRGRCSAARICARPRTRCAAGWPRRRWFAAAPTAEWSPLVAESAVPTVQALIRWDPVGHAEAELDARDEVGLPPAVHMAAVDGAPAAVAALLRDGAAARLRGRCSGPSTCRPVPAGPPAPRRRPGQPDAGAGAARPTASRWPRRCGGPPGCSAPATISSPFGCKSTPCT